MQDGEDLQSCFNLFSLPVEWLGFMAFEKKVSKALFSGPPGEFCYVAIRAVPMGWTAAVDLIQNFIRRFSFDTCGIPAELEVRRDKPFPSVDAAVVCMDGLDIFTRIRIENGAVQQIRGFFQRDSEGRSVELSRLVQECKKRKLPLNHGKSVLMSFSSSILGGELLGVEGRLCHARDKTGNFVNRSLAYLALDEVPQVAAQHWAGIYCFLCSFRRPLFSVVQELFPFIASFGEDRYKLLRTPTAVRDEILLGCLLSPLAFINLRAKLRDTIAISDASESGGAAAEATRFVHNLGFDAAIDGEERALIFLESVEPAASPSMFCCSVCNLGGSTSSTWASCGDGCKARLCSASCLAAHAASWRAAPAVTVDIFGEHISDGLSWALALLGCVSSVSAGEVLSPTAFLFPSGKTL